VNTNFLSLLVWLGKGIKLRSTNYEADALTRLLLKEKDSTSSFVPSLLHVVTPVFMRIAEDDYSNLIAKNETTEDAQTGELRRRILKMYGDRRCF